MQIELLAKAAENARKTAYCPYSKFAVGAALLGKNGVIYTGCNVENVTQGPGCCAERVALYKAVSDGIRDFSAIAICGGPENVPVTRCCTPCGVCRQALAEFCPPDFPVYLVTSDKISMHTLGELFPFGFSLS